ncbi:MULTISPECIES: siderophore-interacting protein [unclassified Pseudoclavibacter]|uniref:siderophore-interacting protein n=1 Tax=unclassified Pseudoclavibacter TaxID=2615177 RepID=UPI001BA4B082|nr:siderophore-interacting protein [Pseudoclavibacter sp. Marseille-Q4354]MBS3177628.1 siderophore-interacting protein [Pseudoclavibacter sp. Marseille-Q4354]
MTEAVVQKPRKRGPTVRLTVVRTERLSRSLVRVHFSGADLDDFDLEHADTYLKLHFGAGIGELELPFDLQELRATLPIDRVPVRRTYTVRGIDRASGTVSVDFVVHGDAGVAGPWARDANPGDVIVASTPHGAYSPLPESDWHLICGDESALPAIARTLEAMPDDAKGAVLVEVGGDEDHIQLEAPTGVTVTWIHRGEHGGFDRQLLAAAVEELELPDGRVQVFAHGEREQMKRLRKNFSARGIDRSQLSLSGYWAAGRTEDAFQSEKREPVGQIF